MPRIGAFVVALAMAGIGCSSTTIETETEPVRVEFAADFGDGQVTDDIWAVVSPDGDLRIELTLDDGAPVYRVVRTFGELDQAVVGVSALGLETSLGSLGTDLEPVDVGAVDAWRDDFTLPTGKERTAGLDGMVRTVGFASADTSVGLEVDLLATDHGVAVRSRIVGDQTGDVRIDWERTSFALPPTSTAWLQQHDLNSFGRPAYEQVRRRGRSVGELGRSPEGWTFPALFEAADHWTLVTEAGVESGAAASHLRAVPTVGEFAIAAPSAFDGNGIGAVEPAGELPFATPWRVIITSTDIGDIVESNLVRHLSSPGPEFPWVEPGVAAWSWWSDQNSPQDPAALRAFVDLAADFGWRYALIDANWNSIEPDEFGELLDYYLQRDVQPLLWYNSGGPNNSVSEAPRGLMNDREVRRAEMERIADLGVAGIKVDFFHSDKPIGVQLYLDILEDAADFELLVVFHGATVPRGWSRTWPNLMTTEAVLGGEQSIFNPAFSSVAPRQNTVLPFTRNVVGSMDFTPVNLGGRYFRRTSNGHELALAVLFESGLQHFVDTPDNYAAQPDMVREFLRDVPVAWDETRYLSGRPDEHIVLARRRGEAWWIAAINGTAEPLTVSFDPSELGVVGRDAVVICDGADNRSFDIDTPTLVEPLDLAMLPSGGCSLRVD